MKYKSFFVVCIACFIFSGCDVMNQLGGAYTMTRCKYEYHSISKLSLAGMDLSKGFSIAYIPQLTAVLSGNASSVPLSFTLNLNVDNPNQSTALLHRLQYVLSIDEVRFTSGSLDQSLNIPSGGSQLLPLTIGVDLATLLKGDSKDAVVNIAKNFIGIGNKPSNVTFHIKPTFMVGNVPVTAPDYIPVKFSFGGEK